MNEPVKLPAKYLKRPRSLLRDLAVGAEGAIGSHIYVAPDRSVYLRADTPLEKPTILTIKVKREPEGFVLWLAKHHEELYEPQPLPNNAEMVPVIRIEEGAKS